MFEKYKMPSLEAGLLIILIVFSIFGIAFLSEDKITGMASKQITGEMVRVSGMDVKEFDFNGDQTAETGDWAWTPTEILKIKIFENGYLGESNDAYNFYRGKDPNGKLGVFRIKKEDNSEEISFAKGDIGSANLKSVLANEDFHDIEIEGSSTLWWDDDLITSDIKEGATYQNIWKQMDAAEKYESPISWQGEKATTIIEGVSTTPYSESAFITEGSETAETDDWAWTTEEINTKTAIYENGYIGKSEDGYEFYRGEGPDGVKGIFRIKPETNSEEVSFAKYDDLKNLDRDTLSVLLSSEDFHDIEIEDSSAFYWLDDDLITSDLSNFGRSEDSLKEAFDRAREYAKTFTEPLKPVTPPETIQVQLRDISQGQKILINDEEVTVEFIDETKGTITIKDQYGNLGEVDVSQLPEGSLEFPKITDTAAPPKTLDERATDAGLVRKTGETDADLQKRIEAAEKTAVPTTPTKMDFEDAQIILKDYNLDTQDIANLGDINLEDMKKDIEILVLKNTASQAEESYKTTTINLASSLKKAEQLKAELDGTLSAEERNKKTVELNTLYTQIKRDLDKWKNKATAYKSAYNAYNDITYNFDRAISDLNSDKQEERDKAIARLQALYLSAKTDKERTDINNKINEVLAGALANTQKQKDAQALSEKIAEIGIGRGIAEMYGATYNPNDGSFMKNGIRGWGFTADGKIDPTIPKPVTPDEKEDVTNKYLDITIDKHNELYPDDQLHREKDGKVYDKNGNEVTVRFNTVIRNTEVTKRSPPSTIEWNGRTQKLTKLEDYKTTPDTGAYTPINPGADFIFNPDKDLAYEYKDGIVTYYINGEKIHSYNQNQEDWEKDKSTDYSQVKGWVHKSQAKPESQELWKTEDGTIFSINTKWSDNQNKDYEPTPFTGQISKIDTIGDEKEPNHIKIRNWFDVKEGTKESKVASISIVDKTDPENMGKDIPIDKTTMTMIKNTIGAKGTISAIKDATGATISFIKEGQETSRISFYPSMGGEPYKIEGNKLTGIKSQTDFDYTLDTNYDGEITQEEKDAEKYVPLTKRFTATEEIDGKIYGRWYADDFRFGRDDIYFTDMYVQYYKKDKDGNMIPNEDPSYYYIEGGKKGDDSPTEILLGMRDGELVALKGKGKVIWVVDGEAIDTETHGTITDSEIGKRAINRATQADSRRWFSNLEFKLTQYKGLSGWSQLIFSDESLASWRESVDKFFSSAYLGTEYWVSGICSKYIPKDQRGTLTMKTKDGLFDVVAHVEGEKTIIENPNGTKRHIYKLTFSVRNPKYSRYDKLKFNVYLYGDRTVQLYPQSIEVEDGNSFTRGSGKREDGKTEYDEQHGKPIVQYSAYNYNTICIKFDSGIINAEGNRENEVCNAIVEYKGSPTEYEQRLTATGTMITSYTPEEPYQETDF